MATRKGRTEPAANVEPINKPRATTRRYTDEQKIAAVSAMRAYGNIATPEAIEAVRKILGEQVASSTLWQWGIEYGDRVDTALIKAEPIPDEIIVSDARAKIFMDMQGVVEKGLKILNEDAKLRDSKSNQLALTVAIMLTKIKELSAITPQVEQAYRAFAYECDLQSPRLDPLVALNDYTEALRQNRLGDHR